MVLTVLRVLLTLVFPVLVVLSVLMVLPILMVLHRRMLDDWYTYTQPDEDDANCPWRQVYKKIDFKSQ